MRSTSEFSPELAIPAAESGAVEFDLVDLLLALLANKRFILFLTALGGILTSVLALILPPLFTAKAVILPPQQQQSSASVLAGQFGSLAAATGLGPNLGLRNNNDLYMGMLRSDSIADDLIQRFNLKKVYHQKLLSRTRVVLEGNTKLESGKDSLISISVTDKDPRRAADMANGFVEELYRLNSRLAVTEASERRLFFEQQLAAEKDRLADAEVEMKKTEEATGVIQPVGQTETVIRQVAQLQADITLHEVQLDSLRTSATEQNPEVIRLTSELTGLRAQLQAMEKGHGGHVPGDISLSTSNVPEAGLAYVRKSREVQYHQLLFDLLARQYEAARMDEAKAAPVIQVVDRAGVPDWKSWPPRLKLGIGGLLGGFFVACSFTLFAFVFARLNAHEEHRLRLAQLRRAAGLRA